MELRCEPFTLPEAQAHEDDRAVIVVQQDDMLMSHLLREFLSVKSLIDIQQQVMRGERVDCY